MAPPSSSGESGGGGGEMSPPASSIVVFVDVCLDDGISASVYFRKRAEDLGATSQTRWLGRSSKVTHVVWQGGDEKVLYEARLAGKKVLTPKWIEASVRAGRWVDEAPYELRADTAGCSASRYLRDAEAFSAIGSKRKRNSRWDKTLFGGTTTGTTTTGTTTKSRRQKPSSSSNDSTAAKGGGKTPWWGGTQPSSRWQTATSSQAATVLYSDADATTQKMASSSARTTTTSSSQKEKTHTETHTVKPGPWSLVRRTMTTAASAVTRGLARGTTSTVPPAPEDVIVIDDDEDKGGGRQGFSSSSGSNSKDTTQLTGRNAAKQLAADPQSAAPPRMLDSRAQPVSARDRYWDDGQTDLAARAKQRGKRAHNTQTPAVALEAKLDQAADDGPPRDDDDDDDDDDDVVPPPSSYVVPPPSSSFCSSSSSEKKRDKGKQETLTSRVAKIASRVGVNRWDEGLDDDDDDDDADADDAVVVVEPPPPPLPKDDGTQPTEEEHSPSHSESPDDGEVIVRPHKRRRLSEEAIPPAVAPRVTAPMEVDDVIVIDDSQDDDDDDEEKASSTLPSTLTLPSFRHGGNVQLSASGVDEATKRVLKALSSTRRKGTLRARFVDGELRTKLSSSRPPKATHLVLPPTRAARTLKVLFALARGGTHIVTTDWVTASVSLDRWLDPNEFLTAFGPARPATPKLFSGATKIHILKSSLGAGDPGHANLSALIAAAGAKTSPLRACTYVLVGDDFRLQRASAGVKAVAKKKGGGSSKVLNVKWLLDAIEHNNPRFPTDGHVHEL